MSMIRYALGLIVLFVVIIGAVTILPRLAGPYRIPWLDDHNTCELPCWRGITPNVTLYDEAVRLLKAMPDVSDIHDFTPSGVGIKFTFPVDNGQVVNGIMGNLNQNAASVVDIMTNTNEFWGDTVRLADLINRLGPPDSLIFGKGGQGVTSITFNYPHLGLYALVYSHKTPSVFHQICPRDRLSTKTELVIYPNFSADVTARVQPWRGFSRYFAILCS